MRRKAAGLAAIRSRGAWWSIPGAAREAGPCIQRDLSEIGPRVVSAAGLDTRGLPVCRLAQIQPSSKAEAFEACAPALVGDGSYVAKTMFPESTAFPSRGRILVFNTVISGRPAILAYVYGNAPVPTSRVIIFRIRSTKGTFGTVLVGSLPATVNRHGYLTSIQLDLHRNFIYRGRPRAYLSATCAAPAGFPGATFPLARVSMTFDDGRTLATTLVRGCKVREG
jgi:hypothetical protein